MEEKTFKSKTIYQGKIINLRLDKVKLPNGKLTEREIIEHPGAVAILPSISPGRIILIKQYRKPVEEILYEIPAGKLNPGEDEIKCARRELEEETGFQAKKITKLVSFYPTPGISNEKISIFKAENLKKVLSSPESDEFIKIEEIEIDEAIRKIRSGEIKDSKTIIGLLMLK